MSCYTVLRHTPNYCCFVLHKDGKKDARFLVRSKSREMGIVQIPRNSRKRRTLILKTQADMNISK